MTEPKQDPIIWAKTALAMRHSEDSTGRAVCPHCGRQAWATYRPITNFSKLRISFSCQYCRRTGSTVWHIVRALSKVSTLAAAAEWLRAQGVEVTPELVETGRGLWDCGRLGRIHLEAEKMAAERQAKEAASGRP